MLPRVPVFITKGFTLPEVTVDAGILDRILRVDSSQVSSVRQDGEWTWDDVCLDVASDGARIARPYRCLTGESPAEASSACQAQLADVLVFLH